MTSASTKRAAQGGVLLARVAALWIMALAPPVLGKLPPVTGVAQVSANETHTCAVTTAGAVLCWGSNDYGQLGDGTQQRRILPTQVTGLESGVVAVAAGNFHTCAVTAGGAVLCWGRNRFGQLGDGTTIDRMLPTPVSSLGSGVQAIATGAAFSCALTSGGGVFCWGSNTFGQLGTMGGNRNTPGAVSGMGSGVRALSTGNSHGCALIDATGGLKCWGYNAGGQLGDGTTTSNPTPVNVVGLGSGVAQVGAGVLHTCAVTTAGAAKCWGNNFYSQLGDGTDINRLSAVQVTGLDAGVAALQAGYYHSCARMTDATMRCWGNNYRGETGAGAHIGYKNTPANVSGLGGQVAAFALGYHHSCAALVDARLQCWGMNDDGQVGNGEVAPPLSRLEPVDVAGLGSGVVALGSGAHHSCAVTSTGQTKCWGRNSAAQLGDGSTLRRFTPVAVSGLSGVAQTVQAGNDHSCVLNSGAVRCWGSNHFAQMGSPGALPPSPPTLVAGLPGSTTTISAGAYHNCAVNSRGRVTCWGNNPFGYNGNPITLADLLEGFATAAAGREHNCAVTTTGAVRCWGSTSSGQFGYYGSDSPYETVSISGLSGTVQSISAGREHTCVVLAGGRVECWGASTYGQGGSPAPVGFVGLDSVRAVRAGGFHNCALTTSGGVKCWGNNAFGQIGDGTTTTAYLPVEVAGLGSGVTAISVGEGHSCALTSAGAVKCWGDNQYAQIGDGSFPGVATPQWVRRDLAFFRDGFEE